MYIIASSIKTSVCIKDVKIINTKTGKGTSVGTRNSTTKRTISSPLILPNKRKVKESGREKWLMISMGIIRGGSHQTGPINCLKYFTPWVLTPTTCVEKKTT